MTPPGLATTDEDRRRWLLDSYDVLGHILRSHPSLSPHVYWDVQPAVLVGRVNGLVLTNKQIQDVFTESCELLGLRIHNPSAVLPGETRLTASTQVRQIEVTVTAALLFDPIP